MGAPDKLPTTKYVHPDQGHTWSGRGKKPRCVEIWLEDGNSLDELLARPDAPAEQAAPMLAAQGIEIQRPSSGGDRDKEREKIARQETAFRTHLVDCILFAAREDALDLIELRLVAAAAYEQRDFETQKLIVRIWRESDAKIERVDTNDLADEIPLMDAPDIYNLLRLITLAGRVRVASYYSDPITTPAAMVAMADRWGIDLESVKKQAATAAKTKKKGA